jgi:hypothetical protein
MRVSERAAWNWVSKDRRYLSQPWKEHNVLCHALEVHIVGGQIRVESELLICHLEHNFFDRVFANESMDRDWLGLTDSVAPIFGLLV